VKEQLTKETRESFTLLAWSAITVSLYVGLGLLMAHLLG